MGDILYKESSWLLSSCWFKGVMQRDGVRGLVGERANDVPPQIKQEHGMMALERSSLTIFARTLTAL